MLLPLLVLLSSSSSKCRVGFLLGTELLVLRLSLDNDTPRLLEEDDDDKKRNPAVCLFLPLKPSATAVGAIRLRCLAADEDRGMMVDEWIPKKYSRSALSCCSQPMAVPY